VHVAGVAANDTLSLRSSPDAKSAKTGTLPPDATGIAVVAVDSKGTDWVKITKGKVSGWVNAKFLRYESGAPVRLTCQGTEPFWFVNTGYLMANVDAAETKSKIALDEPETPAARPYPWLYPVHGKAASFLLVDENAACSDDMSDTKFAYSMLLHAGGVFMEGCCN
jgi:uncharacterized membrane protein